MAGFGRAFLPILTQQEGNKASGSLPKACRDWREKAQNAQKRQKNDQKVLYLGTDENRLFTTD